MACFCELFMKPFKMDGKRRTTLDSWSCCVHLNNGKSTIISRDGGFCADPFFLTKDVILYEYYSFLDSRGWIEAYDLNTGSAYKVYDNGLHASFPFVFYHEGMAYVMPEQKECFVLEAFPVAFGLDGRVRLDDRKSIKLCEDVPIVDAMLLRMDGGIYCLYNEDVGRIGDPGGTLFLAKVDFAHQGLTVSESTLLSADFRVARNAGTVWYKNQSIYRVFQYKEPGGYGNGISLDRIRFNRENGFENPRHDVLCPPFFKEHQLNRLSHHLDIKVYGKVWDARLN